MGTLWDLLLLHRGLLLGNGWSFDLYGLLLLHVWLLGLHVGLYRLHVGLLLLHVGLLDIVGVVWDGFNIDLGEYECEKDGDE